jgi:hypothetical protein
MDLALYLSRVCSSEVLGVNAKQRAIYVYRGAQRCCDLMYLCEFRRKIRAAVRAEEIYVPPERVAQLDILSNLRRQCIRAKLYLPSSSTLVSYKPGDELQGPPPLCSWLNVELELNERLLVKPAICPPQSPVRKSAKIREAQVLCRKSTDALNSAAHSVNCRQRN